MYLIDMKFFRKTQPCPLTSGFKCCWIIKDLDSFKNAGATIDITQEVRWRINVNMFISISVCHIVLHSPSINANIHSQVLRFFFSSGSLVYKLAVQFFNKSLMTWLWYTVSQCFAVEVEVEAEAESEVEVEVEVEVESVPPLCKWCLLFNSTM